MLLNDGAKLYGATEHLSCIPETPSYIYKTGPKDLLTKMHSEKWD